MRLELYGWKKSRPSWLPECNEYAQYLALENCEVLQGTTKCDTALLNVFTGNNAAQGPAGQLLPAGIAAPIQGGTTQRTLLNMSTSSKGLRKSRTLHGGAEIVIQRFCSIDPDTNMPNSKLHQSALKVCWNTHNLEHLSPAMCDLMKHCSSLAYISCIVQMCRVSCRMAHGPSQYTFRKHQSCQCPVPADQCEH